MVTDCKPRYPFFINQYKFGLSLLSDTFARPNRPHGVFSAVRHRVPQGQDAQTDSNCGWVKTEHMSSAKVITPAPASLLATQIFPILLTWRNWHHHCVIMSKDAQCWNHAQNLMEKTTCSKPASNTHMHIYTGGIIMNYMGIFPSGTLTYLLKTTISHGTTHYVYGLISYVQFSEGISH